MHDNIQNLLELANNYPSPHNGQPIEIKAVGGDTYEVYFQCERGLQAAEISFLFSYVTMGVFMHHLSLSAAALGHALSSTLELPLLSSIKGEGLVKFATCKIRFDAVTADSTLHDTLRFRQTSRKKYYDGLDDGIAQKTIRIAMDQGMELVKMNKTDTHQAIWLNQRAVFDDMFDDAVRQELDHWLRYTKHDKETKQDGLAYDCMELSGSVMKFITNHYKVLRMPGVGGLLKKYYLRTMSDNSDVFYLLTPFSTELEAYTVGVAIMKIWNEIAAKGYYLHPFGTIMSNTAAHDDFLKLARIEHEDIHKNFLVFIYRAGKSEKPTSSLRIPVDQHLFRSDHV